MKQKFLALTLMGVLAVSTVACGGNPPKTEEQKTEVSKEEEEKKEVSSEPEKEVTEEPEEEAAAEPTEEVAAEPTEEVVAEPTKEAVAEPTEEVTAEPTKEAVAESTEPTEEAVAEPTEEVVADDLKNDMVFMDGANFTNMKVLYVENNEDGTYRYEDTTEDGLTRIVNMCVPNDRFEPDIESYIQRFVMERGGMAPEDIMVSQDPNGGWFVLWSDFFNDENYKALGKFDMTEHYAYLYFLSSPFYNFQSMGEVYDEVIKRVHLEQVG